MKSCIKYIVGFLLSLFVCVGLLRDVVVDRSSTATVMLLDTEQSDTSDAFQCPSHYVPCASAELGGFTAQGSLMSLLRIQRTHFSEVMQSLKDIVLFMSLRMVDLSKSVLQKSYFSSPFYRCHPVCQYYIFTLKRILI